MVEEAELKSPKEYLRGSLLGPIGRRGVDPPSSAETDEGRSGNGTLYESLERDGESRQEGKTVVLAK